MTGRWLLLDFALVVASFAWAVTLMGYPWQLALLTALAIGALSYSGRRTYWNLRLLHRPPDEGLAESDEGSDDGGASG